MTITEEDYKWICDAYNYGAASTLGAAAKRLTIFRQHILSGGNVRIRPQVDNIDVNIAHGFDKWVSSYFPDLTGTSLYPYKLD